MGGGGGRRVEGHIVILYPPGSGRGLASDSSPTSKNLKKRRAFQGFFFFLWAESFVSLMQKA